MGDFPRTILELDLSADKIIARADSHRPKDERWTVLTIYHVDDLYDFRMQLPFIAEIVGETTVEGEQRRVRRNAFPTLAQTLEWGAFNAKSALFGELRQKAIAWMEPRASDHVLMSPAAWAITLLRALVAAARSGDEAEINAACTAAERFLEGQSNARDS